MSGGKSVGVVIPPFIYINIQTKRGKTMKRKTLLILIMAVLLTVLPFTLVFAAYLKWYDDGGVDLITFEDEEIIHLTKQQLGTMFGPGKKPFTGKRIAITVNNSGPKGGISGPMYRIRPAWEELTGAKLDIVEMPLAEQLNKTINDLRLGTGQFDGFVEGAWYMGEYITPGFIIPIDKYIADKRFPFWDTKWLPP